MSIELIKPVAAQKLSTLAFSLNGPITASQFMDMINGITCSTSNAYREYTDAGVIGMGASFYVNSTNGQYLRFRSYYNAVTAGADLLIKMTATGWVDVSETFTPAYQKAGRWAVYCDFYSFVGSIQDVVLTLYLEHE